MDGGVVWHDMACLIVIYDCVGTYDGIGWHVGRWWWWIVGLLVEFVVMSVSIYYSNYICTVGWCCWLLYMMISCWYRSPGTQHGWQYNDDHSWWWWCHYQYQYCMPGAITYCPMWTIQMAINHHIFFFSLDGSHTNVVVVVLVLVVVLRLFIMASSQQ